MPPMNLNSIVYKSTRFIFASIHAHLLRAFFAGVLIPFGFAPFHLPGLTILGLALLYAQLRGQTKKLSFWTGFTFGVGFFGLGITWVYVSIHEYGHLNAFISACITLLFVIYLSLYPALLTFLYSRLKVKSALFSCFLFSALWCLSEYLRATVMGGFPWLLVGFGQIDTPLKYLLPVVGVYGVSFLTCLAATFLVNSMLINLKKRYLWTTAFVGILVIPSILKHHQWTAISKTPVSVGIIQANLSMRDKWDETLFWQLLQHYKDGIDSLVGKAELVVMPESAIPLPANYVSDFLDTIHLEAKQADSSILLGIPQPTNAGSETYYSNSIIALGAAEGRYLKQHLVPFGEFIPQPFERIIHWLSLPPANLKPGNKKQLLIRVHNHPIATLICYELAYPQLLRNQLPEAEWIVSVSDDGWFGHSLAMYQQLQIAQVLSLQTGRYQVVANNDGLSSIIDSGGNIAASLSPFVAGILESNLYSAIGSTPWLYFGDMPALFLIIVIVILVIFLHIPRREPQHTAKLISN